MTPDLTAELVSGGFLLLASIAFRSLESRITRVERKVDKLVESLITARVSRHDD